jgi:hypothetical protein
VIYSNYKGRFRSGLYFCLEFLSLYLLPQFRGEQLGRNVEQLFAFLAITPFLLIHPGVFKRLEPPAPRSAATRRPR